MPTPSKSSNLNTIDAVVTWVDGSDPAHIRKRNFALGQTTNTPSSTILAGVDQTRFENSNEIEYCLRSIRKFAPWVRNIFLVTDEQCPHFLTDNVQRQLGVQLIDHRQIFINHEEVLPTFNSLSIETVLHRIPDLSERYIYFNDDFILTAPTRVEDFFCSAGIVLRGQWAPLQKYSSSRLFISKLLNRVLKSLLGINRAMSTLQQIRGANQAGAIGRYYKVGHTPYPMRKSTVESFFSKHPQALASNISYRFRSLDQYAVTSLANQLEIAGEHADLRSCHDALMLCFNRDSRNQLKKKLERVQKNDNVRFLCIQSLEQADEKDKETLFQAIQNHLMKHDVLTQGQSK